MARRTSGCPIGPQVYPPISNKRSPFSLVYGTDAMIPVEIGEPSLRRELYDPVQNHQNMTTHLDLLPELREREWPESITRVDRRIIAA